jgi:hypothetical protein
LSVACDRSVVFSGLLRMFDLSFYNKLKLSITICDGSALDAELCQYHAWFLVKQAKIDKTECTKRWVRVMAFNATFINISVISWRSVLLVQDTGVPGENHRPVASHWQTLSHTVVRPTWAGFELTDVSWTPGYSN